MPDTTFRRIVVGCNGEAESLDALDLACTLAGATGANLLLGYVFDQQPSWYGTQRFYQRAQRARNHAVLEGALDLLPEGVRHQAFALGSSSPARGLHELAEGEGADLLVLGSTHRGRLGRVLPGSVGEVLLHGAPCAVMVAPRGYREHRPHAIGRVGVGFDGSAESDRALASADSLAASLGASLEAISVVPRHRLTGNGETHPFTERLDSALRSLGRNPEDAAKLVAGEPARSLCDAACALDLLIAGSRSYGPMRHVLLGSVSGPLMRACPCPVLILPRSAPPRRWEPSPLVAADPA
jgi:nucleotide-binding universal stress UspA family protein